MRENVPRYMRLALDVGGLIGFGFSSAFLAPHAFAAERCPESLPPDAFKCAARKIGGAIINPLAQYALAQPAFNKPLQTSDAPNLGYSMSTIFAAGCGLDASRIVLKSIVKKRKSNGHQD